MDLDALGGEEVAELLLDVGLHVAGDFLVEEGLADVTDDLADGGDAEVGEVEAFFQLGEEILIDLAADAEQRGDAREDAARPGEALLDLVEDGAEDHEIASRI